MFVIYRNAGTVKYDMCGYDQYDDAVDMCEFYEWCIVDENGFEWWLSIEEEDGVASDYYMPVDEPDDEFYDEWEWED